MKKIVLTALVGLITLTVSNAQNNPQPNNTNKQQGIFIHKQEALKEGRVMAKRFEATPEEIAKRQTENMKTKLALTPDQEKKIYELNLNNAKEQIKAREAIKAQRVQMLKNQKLKDSLVNNILTPEQKRFHELYKHLNKQRLSVLKGRNMQRINMMRMKAKGMQQGMMQGMQQGMKQGMMQGMQQGEHQGEKQGMHKGMQQGMQHPE